MKYLILICFFISSLAFSFPVPDSLKDGTITVTTKDGKVYNFSENQWKVVPRTVKKKVVPKKDLPKVENKTATDTSKTTEPKKENPNSIFIVVGAGKTKITSSEVVNGEVTVEHEYEPIYGLRYVRHKGEYSMSLDYLSNKTATVGLGYSFSDL